MSDRDTPVTMREGYDYRLSHLQKGAPYEESFSRNPWRAYVWQREQKVLDAVLDRYFSGKAVTLLDFACGTGRILRYLLSQIGRAHV